MRLHAIPRLQPFLKRTLSDTQKERLHAILEWMQIKSLRAAIREQHLWELQQQLAEIVPDLRQQYTAQELNSGYLVLKARGQHAFQIWLACKAIGGLRNLNGSVRLIDVGDSAGTHIQYLQALHTDLKLQCIGLNRDVEAVRKIKGKGLEAICARAEDITGQGLDADIFVSFQMLEHLENPISFLRSLSAKSNCQAFVVTVPYLRQSRLGFHHVRRGVKQRNSPEMTHIFELYPSDWTLLFMHAGWRVQEQQLYLQYPRHSLFRVMKPVWKAIDFEGFWGAILVRDHTWSDLYEGKE